MNGTALGGAVGGWWQGEVDLDFGNTRYRQGGIEYASYAAWAATVTVAVVVDTDATYFDASGVMQNAASNALRFDHDPATLANYGLLLEGARTNLKLRSQELNTSAGSIWTPVRVTVGTDAIASPDGGTNAESLLETAVTNTFHLDSNNVTVTTGSTYAQSVFFKKLGRRYVTIDGNTAAAVTIFDLDNAAVQATSGAERVASGIQSLLNGWVRGWETYTEAVSATVNPRIFINDLAADGISGTHAGDITKGVYAWGVQLELGAFPSSYIRTTSAAVARSADTFTETVANEASGSVRLYFRTAPGLSGDQVLWQRDDGTETNRIRCKRASDGHLHWIVTTSSSDVVDIDLGVVADLTVGYTDFNFATNDYSASLNGGTATTDVSGTMPVGLTTIRRGHQVDGTSNWFGHLLREVRGVTKAGVAPFDVAFGFATDWHYSSTKADHDSLYLNNGRTKAAAAVAHWNAARMDFAMFNGDLVEGYGGPTQAEQLVDIANIVADFSAANAQVYYCLGNHDFDKLTRAQVLAACGLSSGYYSFDVGTKLHMVVLDGNYSSTADNSGYSAGAFDFEVTYLNDAQRTWLAADLAATTLPTIVFCHQRIDTAGQESLDNASDVRTILEASSKVMLVVMGHHHVNALNYINTIPYLSMKDGASDAVAANATCAFFNITSDRIIVTGFGSQTSRSLPRRV